jgi:uncharacterized protein YbaA (DUF1428 family)
MATRENRPAVGYVDIYLLPVPKEKIESYRQQATTFAEVTRELGALSYCEFRGDDLSENLKVAAGEALTAAVAEFESGRTGTR